MDSADIKEWLLQKSAALAPQLDETYAAEMLGMLTSIVDDCKIALAEQNLQGVAACLLTLKIMLDSVKVPD